MVASSQIASGSKVGSQSPPYLVFLAEISLERLSMFSMSLPRSGLGRRFGGLEVQEVLRMMEPMQSGFLSVFASAHSSDAHMGSSRFTKVKVAELSKKPKALNHPQAASLGLSLVCAWIAVHRLSEVKPTDNVLVIGKITLLSRAFSPVYGLAGARGGIGSGAVQLFKEKGVTNIYGTYRTVPPDTPSGLKPVALPDATAISTALKASGDFGKIDVVVDCAGYEDPLNDALKTMRDQGRVIVMAVHRPDGRFSIDLRTFYMKSLVMKGLKSSALNATEVKEMLDYLSGKYDDGTIEPPKKVGTVSMWDLGDVHNALEVAAKRSQDRIVILP